MNKHIAHIHIPNCFVMMPLCWSTCISDGNALSLSLSSFQHSHPDTLNSVSLIQGVTRMWFQWFILYIKFSKWCLIGILYPGAIMKFSTIGQHHIHIEYTEISVVKTANTPSKHMDTDSMNDKIAAKLQFQRRFVGELSTVCILYISWQR